MCQTAVKHSRIAIVGLGYVGLPLALEFGKIRQVIGFDIDERRVQQLKDHIDVTNEVDALEFEKAGSLVFTYSLSDLADCKIFIITVPTPINEDKTPNLSLLYKASEMVAKVLKPGDLVIYESTVYPGVTEDECAPILEAKSGLKFNTDFFCGYSPERINPGDRNRRLKDIMKVTAGSTQEATDMVDELYSSIILAGTHKSPSIKVAEAAKVIENTQRDLNIALVNELSIIFEKMGIDTKSVLDAASTKWNFLPFSPGLVGGHCIGVDPYYLTHKAETLGYTPEVILAGRKINDGMSSNVATRLVQTMLEKKITIHGSKVLVLGFTFKENCPDIRNTKVNNLLVDLEGHGISAEVYDPWVAENDVSSFYSVKVCHKPKKGDYDGIVLAVPHDHFVSKGPSAIKSFGKPNHVFFDLKAVFKQSDSDLRL